VELSKKAHELAKRYYEQNDLQAREELKEVEGEIDKTVAELYGITDEELEEVRLFERYNKIDGLMDMDWTTINKNKGNQPGGIFIVSHPPYLPR